MASEILSKYLSAFAKLKVNKTAGHASPHKPCMLLAVIGISEAGELERNEIRFDPALLERYLKYFAAVRLEGDRSNPNFPFFHLQSEGFWHLKPLPGREAIVQAMESAREVAPFV